MLYDFYQSYKNLFNEEPCKNYIRFNEFCERIYKKLFPDRPVPTTSPAFVNERGDVWWFYYPSDIANGYEKVSEHEKETVEGFYLSTDDFIGAI